MSQLISLTGNICSGKTTVAKQIHHLTGWPVFFIDEYRIKHNAQFITEEWKAWEDLIHRISKEKNAILETTGLSNKLLPIYEHFSRVCITKLNAPMDLLVQRITDRNKSNYTYPPYCYSRNQTPLQAAVKLALPLQNLEADYTFETTHLTPGQIAQRILKTLQH